MGEGRRKGVLQSRNPSSKVLIPAIVSVAPEIGKECLGESLQRSRLFQVRIERRITFVHSLS